MDNGLSLTGVERSIFQAYWDDGLIDLFLGIGLVLVGIAWLNGLIVGAAIVPPLLLPPWLWMRRRVTAPRSGRVRFSQDRIERTRIGLNVAGVTGFALLTLFGAVFVILNDESMTGFVGIGWLVPALPSWIVAVALVVGRLGFGMPRFLVHAGILTLAGLLGSFASVEPGWQFVGAGLVVGATGAQLFWRFLRDNPDIEANDADAR